MKIDPQQLPSLPEASSRLLLMKKRLTIRNLLHLIHGAVAILVVALAVSVGLLFANHDKLIESERLRLESDHLSAELQMSSDVLTHFARAYVVTGDPKFEGYYWQVLAIRNGEEARPEQYERIYWHLVAATGKVPRGSTAGVSLQKLMRDVGFTKEEFAKLRAAQEYSDALVKTEEIAMHAVKGVYEDASGNFSLHGEPDQARARNMLFDQTYYSQKARIMQSIDDCDVLLSARTRALTEHYQNLARRYLFFAIGCLVLLLIVMPVSFMAVRKRIGAPVDKLREQARLVATDLVRLTNIIRSISHGEWTESFRVKAEPLLCNSGDEIGELTLMQNEMISALQDSGAAIARLTVEQMEAEKGLRESEEKFRQLADNVADVFWITSPDLQTLHYASAGYEKIWGRSMESLMANPLEWSEAILPEERERVYATFSRLATEASVQVEFPIARPDGTIRWILSRGFQVRDASGEVIRISGIASDMTERKRAAEELRESDRRFSDMLGNLELISMMLDRDARVTYCNDHLLRLTGWQRDEVIGQNWPDLFLPPGLVEELHSVHSALLDNQSAAWHHENEIITRSGGRRLIRWNNSVLRSATGSVIGTASIGEDITERKAGEKAVQEAEEKYRSMFENAAEGIYQTTPQGDVLAINPAAARILGFSSPEQILTGTGRKAYGYVDPKRLGEFMRLVEERNGVNGFESEVFRPDGSKVWVSENVRVVRGGSEEILFFEGTLADITERKRAEAERQVISEIVQGVITTSNLDELLHLAHRSIGKVLYAENCFVALHDTKTDLVRFEFWIDKFDPLPPPHPVGRGHIRTNSILRTGKPLVLTKELEARLCAQGAIAKTGSAAASWMGVPLRTPTRTIGVLAVQHYEKEDAYSQRDLEFLSSVGNQIALAIERKRADDDLKRSEERLAAAQKMAHVGSWEWDVITNKVIWSDEEYRLFGLEPGEREATYDLYLSFVHPDAQQDALKWFNAVRAMKKSSRMDILIVRQDGKKRILNSWADVVLDEEGNVVRIIGTSQDVTEREEAERALGQSEERFQLVSRATDDAIWDWDVGANTISFSESFRTLFGYRAGEFDSTTQFWMKGIHPDDHDAIMASVYSFFATREESWSGEYRFRCADGSYAFVCHRGYVVRDVEGKPLRMVGSMMNITSQKQAQEDLRVAKEAAEAASRAKSEFLANMSHEIRTPMNGIIGMTDLALETDLNRDQREYLGMVKNSAHSLLGLINDILDFSKIEAGKLELESIGFSLRDCIAGMLKPLGLRADQKGLELVADISSNVPDHLVGDPMRLRQILINLTDNAIKFTERGDVVVSVSSQSIGKGESELTFCVSDTGIGIPQDKQAAIFEAFAQADGSTTRTYGGTGLGLSIASQLIQQMGGRIWIESKVGEGTTFHFTARLGVRAAPSPARHAEPRDLEGLRALVVDDNAVNRRVLREMLVNWRMKPTVVNSGAAALEEMTRAANANAAYEVVLLDAMMPEMDGFALAEKINAQPALADATVMMLSSAMPAGTAERCSELGIAGWLSKPITQSELLDAILIAVSPEADDGSVSRVAEIQVAESGIAGSGLRILVAEDNLVNRAVATGILEKAGHVLVHVATGREAVEAFSDGFFDLIFMDVQMPEMDGFEATRRIRELEETTGGHITIVAMTAHAMAGDRERCLAAGMDDYVSKPLRKEDLLRALSGADPKAEEDKSETIFLHSRAEMLAQCDGDEELMKELVSIFQENTPQIVRSIGDAIAKRDAPALAASAHKLLSSLGAFGAKEAGTLARRLERHGLENDFRRTKERFTELERETDKIYAALA